MAYSRIVYIVSTWNGKEFSIADVYTSKKRMLRDWSGRVSGWTWTAKNTK